MSSMALIRRKRNASVKTSTSSVVGSLRPHLQSTQRVEPQQVAKFGRFAFVGRAFELANRIAERTKKTATTTNGQQIHSGKKRRHQHTHCLQIVDRKIPLSGAPRGNLLRNVGNKRIQRARLKHCFLSFDSISFFFKKKTQKEDFFSHLLFAAKRRKVIVRLAQIKRAQQKIDLARNR